jgi:hypothetical protein
MVKTYYGNLFTFQESLKKSYKFRNMTQKMLKCILVFATLFLSGFAKDLQQRLSFNRDIRPILSENCYLCHGFDKKKRKGKLRLDTFEGATKLSHGEAAIVPGHPEQSLLIDRIETHDLDELMPPPDTVYKLKKHEKETLKQWIREGATYEEHWAYLPIAINHANSIDDMLEKKRQEKGLESTLRADPRTLIRRLSFDLRGLPPKPEEVKAFEKDPSQHQFGKIIDQYLESLEHAEHQALKWLDLVRWANTTGMVSDEPFASEGYRNYVIQSFHDNVPFDTFTIEQLAGDLIKKPTMRSLVASGYNRIVKTNCEAGVIEEEALYDLKGEHVRALGTVWMGITTGCAECHDHKYDPFTQQDYYNMAAFFDDLVEAGCYTPGDRRIPLHYVHDKPEDQKKDEQVYAELQKKYTDFYDFESIDEQAYKSWQAEKVNLLKSSKNLSDYLWLPANLPFAHEMSGDYTVELKSKRLSRKVKAKKDVVKRHFIAETMTGFFAKGTGTDQASRGLFVDLWIDPIETPKWIAIQSLHGAYGRLGWEDSETITFVWANSKEDYEKDRHYFKSDKIQYMGELPNQNEWIRLYGDKAVLKKAKWHHCGMAWMQSGGTVHWGNSGLTMPTHKVEEFKMGVAGMRMFQERPYHRMDYDKRFSWPAKIVKMKQEDRSQTERELLKRRYLEERNVNARLTIEKLEASLGRLRVQAQEVLVSRSGQSKMTRVLARGDFMDKTGLPATPAIPAYFGMVNTQGKKATRLDLAQWLVSEENPLTARVYVNRLWAQFFGKGFSTTLEDIGSQGEWPSHPELVDKLAYDFISSGWDTRKIIKTIVMSKAYQLSSMPHESQIELDIENRYLSKQNRFRHHAEAIRDQVLAISGLLNQTKALPKDSKFFYQPDAYWKLSSKVMYGSRHMKWETSQNKEQHYRSVYGFYKRQNAHPTFLAFDAPTRQECSTNRSITNTPAQALTMLNDPIFVEAAKALGLQVSEFKTEPRMIIQKIISKSLQRMPTEKESNALIQLFTQQQAYYRDHPEEAKLLLGGNSFKKNFDAAAWIIVSRVVLNLHETITRL